MIWLTISLLFIIPTIILVNLQQAAINTQKKLNTNQIGETIDRLLCSQGWTQLNYTCYHLSDQISTVSQANRTCDRHYSNTSQLMYIEQSIDLFYAAHVLTKYNLNSLLLEIDPNLMKNAKIIHILSSNFNDNQWREFGEKLFPNKTPTSNENIDSIRKPCDEYRWNVIDENSNTLILTVSMNSNKSICSLSNINVEIAYDHLCQYSLDRCRKNNPCGKHGHCVNNQTGFKCICSFFYDGDYCKSISPKDVQLVIAISVVILSLLLLIDDVRTRVLTAMHWFLSFISSNILSLLFKLQPVLNRFWKSLKRFILSKTKKKDDENNQQTNQTILFELNSNEKRIRLGLIFLLSSFLSVLLIGNPVVRYFLISKTDQTNSSTLTSVINNQYGRNTIFQNDNFLFFIFSIGISIILTIFNIKHHKDDKNYMTIIEPIKPFHITDRYTTAVIVSIQMFEILEVLDETQIDIQQASQSGVFVKIFIRLCFVIINAFRYYPVLASLQFQDLSIRILASIYFVLNLVHMMIRENLHLCWLTYTNKISLFNQTDTYTNMHYWPFMYSVMKNTIYYCLIGYICAELIVRMWFDSIYIIRKIGKTKEKRSKRNIDEYSFSENQLKDIAQGVNQTSSTGNQKQNSNEQGYWFRIRKSLSEIYRKEKDFRLTTIVICTYAIAYIFLIHLAFNLICFYTTNYTTYMTYLIQLIERLLNIDIEEQSFQMEIIISAMITTLIFGLQLLHSIQNYKDSIRNLYRTCRNETKPVLLVEENEIIPKSVQYPAFILRYLLGGYVICFHSLLITMIGLNAIRKQITSFKWTLISILSIVCVYGLHQIISILFNALFISYRSKDKTNPTSSSQEDQTNTGSSPQDEVYTDLPSQEHTTTDSLSQNQIVMESPAQNKKTIKLNRPYSILLYFNLISTSFIGIVSTVFRLIISFFANVLFLPRIDYSCFPPPLQRFDSAYVSFECFIRWEFLYTYPLILQFSQLNSPANITTVRESRLGETVSNDADEKPSEATAEVRADGNNQLHEEVPLLHDV